MSEVSGYGKKGFFTEENSQQIKEISSRWSLQDTINLIRIGLDLYRDEYGNEFIYKKAIIPGSGENSILFLKKAKRLDMVLNLLNKPFFIQTNLGVTRVSGICSGCFSDIQMKNTETLIIDGEILSYIEPFAFENFKGNVWLYVDNIVESNHMLLPLVFYGSEGNLTIYSSNVTIERMKEQMISLGIVETNGEDIVVKGTSMKVFFEENSQTLSIIPVYPFTYITNTTFYTDRNGNYYMPVSSGSQYMALCGISSNYKITYLEENCKIQLPDHTEKILTRISLNDILQTSNNVAIGKIPSSISFIQMKSGMDIDALDITSMSITTRTFNTQSFDGCNGSLKLTNAQMEALRTNGWVDDTDQDHHKFINSDSVLFEVVEETE